MHLPTLASRLLPLLLAPAVLAAQQGSSAPSSPPAPMNRAAFARTVDSLVADYLASAPASAATVAVVRGRDTLVLKGYGLADRAANRAANAATIYRIGSITKQYTAAAVMRLVEQGKLKLDDDISTYLDFPLQGHHVTVHQLLNHSSGIHSYTASPAWRATWAADLTPDSVVGFVKRDTFDFAPGTDWRYNNSGYVLLGMLIEKVTGKPYATYLQEQFFRPLGLRRTSYCPSKPTDPAFAAGYSRDEKSGGFAPAAYLSMTHPYAAGALCASVPDFLKWQAALHGGRVVNAESYRRMTTPDTFPGGKRPGYGYGLIVNRLGAHRVIAHDGGINGFVTTQSWFPDDSLEVVVFTNSDTDSPNLLGANIARAMFGIPMVKKPVVPKAVAMDTVLAQQVVGTYELVPPPGGKFVVHLFMENGTLMARAEGPGQGAFPLVYYGDGVFGARFDPTLRLSFTITDGKGSAMKLEQRGMVMQGPRRP